MGDIVEGGIEFMYAMKLMPPKNLGNSVHSLLIENTIQSNIFTESLNTWHYSRQVCIFHRIKSYHSTDTFEHALIILYGK